MWKSFHGSFQVQNLSQISRVKFWQLSLSDLQVTEARSDWFRMRSDDLSTGLQDAIVKYSVAGSPITVYVRTGERTNEDSLDSGLTTREGMEYFKPSMYHVYNVTVLEWNEYRKMTEDGGLILCIRDCRKSFAKIVRPSLDADLLSLDLHCRIVKEDNNDFTRRKVTAWREFDKCARNASQEDNCHSVPINKTWTSGKEWKDCNMKMILGDFELASGLERCLQQIYIGQQCKAWMRAPYLNTFKWNEGNVRGEGGLFGPSAEALYEFEWKVLNITPKFKHSKDQLMILAKKRKALGNQLMELEQFEDAKEVYFRALDLLGDLRVEDEGEASSNRSEVNVISSSTTVYEPTIPARELEATVKINLATADIQLKNYDEVRPVSSYSMV